MKKSITLLLLVCSFPYLIKSATCVSTGNGAWSNAAIWSCGHVPACGDSIVIQAAHTVTVTNQQDYSACASPPKLAIYGRLQFDNGNKLRLPCNSVIYIFSSGSIVPGSGGGNSNYIEICSDILWSAGDGSLFGSGCLPPSAPGCAAVLPIELVSFNAQINAAKVDVKWITASEKNNSHFIIQRSTDAQMFDNIATVTSKAQNGNSQSQLNYNSEDKIPVSGVSYYRLKQVDKDQSFSYSKVVSVNFIKDKNIRFVIYPNPNNGEFTADISGIENNHQIKIILTNEKGEKVYHAEFFINDSANSSFRIIPSDKLPSGLYVCTLILEGIEYKVKVIVS